MRKTISITNQDVLDQLEKQPNQSKYIEQLILADIDQNPLNADFVEKLVEKTVQKYLETGKVVTASKPMDEKVKSSIKKHGFGMLK
ncbi:hypothetical protein SDC9_158461 [bioreactor metagenome]|uniref:Uncharacterized protein n=1 Tax=bioreactor metagenome TaxID=1076179 RepID=A0A645FB62_9ZZZZ